MGYAPIYKPYIPMSKVPLMYHYCTKFLAEESEA